jgi:hypothetical protein
VDVGVTRKDERAVPGNAVHGDVYGPVLQVGALDGDVHVHHDAPTMHVVTTRWSTPAFGPGARIAVGDHDYLVHDHLVAEGVTDDGRARCRTARVSSRGETLGWLRQVDDRAGTGAGRALADEHALLKQHVADLHDVLQFHCDDRSTTLVTVWPRERSGRPSDSLHELLDNGRASDGAGRLCAGLAGLCDLLGALHDRGLAHRALCPAALLARDDGRLVPLDLGLAVHAARNGEHQGGYQAPEQSRRGTPGPWTDVHQVGAIAHRVLTGRLPNPTAPPPVRAWEPAITESTAATIDAALAGEPTARPDIRALGAALRHAVR